jgi:hypothetical protein
VVNRRTVKSIGWLGGVTWLVGDLWPPCFNLLLPEVPRYHRAIISLDAAKLLPAIDDDEVEVYGIQPRQD